MGMINFNCKEKKCNISFDFEKIISIIVATGIKNEKEVFLLEFEIEGYEEEVIIEFNTIEERTEALSFVLSGGETCH